MKKSLLVPIFALVTIALAATTLWHIEFQFQRIDQPSAVPPPPVNASLSRAKVGQFWTHQTAKGTKYAGFLHKSCADTLSFGYTWFSTIFNIACDKSDPSPLCTVRLDNSNGYVSLGEKSLALWKQVNEAEDLPDIIVKLDDDTIIQKNVLDDFVDYFASKPCFIGGTMVPWKDEKYNFWWPLGRLYMFKRSSMPAKESERWKIAEEFNKYEDGQIGYIMGAPTETQDHICWLDGNRYWHSKYTEEDQGWDKRMEIKFRYLSAGCPTPEKSTA
ncbi:hypothetical protein BGW41_005560 [Actinomortierella wolfii]|nr:hypothetical protein BGW41_005560 [Actinomortierella wolfii]